MENNVYLFFILLLTIGFALSQQSVEFVECPLYTRTSFPENTKNLDLHKFRYASSSIPLIGTINELNTKYNSTLRTKAECSMVPLPINYKDENSHRIKIFVKRLRFKPNMDAKKALWLLQGGPGGASDGFELPMDALVTALEGEFDIYTLDHRGVGRSGRLTCDASQAETLGSDGGYFITYKEWGNCAKDMKIEYGDNLQTFSSLGAAVDLVKLIQLINVPKNQDTFIYGVSYGTVWVTRLMRYLEINKLSALVKGIIMDGIVSTKNRKFTIDIYDKNQDLTGNYYLDLCGKDKFCSEKLNTDNPVQYMKDVVSSVYDSDSHCKQFKDLISKENLRAVFGSLIVNPYSRPLIPALLYRLKRCDKDIDIPFLSNIGSIYQKIFASPQFSNTLPLYTAGVQTNIVLSELWNNSNTLQLLKEEATTLYFASGAPVDAATIKDITNYPAYNLDPDYFNEAFNTNIPVLLLNGDLDPQTPLWSAKEQNENIGGNSHALITIPYAPHATLIYSEQKNTFMPCGMELIISFIRMENPDVSKIDRKCLNNLNFNFTGSPLSNYYSYGVEDLYEGNYRDPNEGGESTKISLPVFIGIEVATVFVSVILVFGVVIFFVRFWKPKAYASLN